MNIKTVDDIRKIRDDIREKIKTLNLKQFQNQTFGQENEYSYRGLIGGIESLLTDLSTLTQHKNKFLKLSDYDERRNIISTLNNILSYLENPSNLYSYVNNLKKILRNYNVRNFSEHQIEFEKEIENVRKIKMELKDVLRDALMFKMEINKNSNLIKETQEDIDKKLENSIETFKEISQKLKEMSNETDKQQTLNEDLDSIKRDAEISLDTISEFEKEASSNNKLIQTFAENIHSRDKRLAQIEAETNSISEKLKKYEEERKSILKEAQNLIETAKQALNYKTAEGLSAAFSTQHEQANKWYYWVWWIVGAGVCLCGTLGLGLWVMYNIQDQWFMILGRILLLPIPIIGAVFCANQYTKQKNIIEDYAYKQTIAKAIVGFSEELNKNGKDGDNSEYVNYIKQALTEIHKDPLRSRKEDKPLLNLKNNQLEQLIELAKKIIEIGKSNT
ncbi:hypothetical protein [Capnocytophaga canis]|uniref:hypothetical protein n=1 Tax=Capnocytophaga canis TaxID=1848903 RepID=UPI0015626343|nr:hypothetical protein [Capnocytophaga canis]